MKKEERAWSEDWPGPRLRASRNEVDHSLKKHLAERKGTPRTQSQCSFTCLCLITLNVIYAVLLSYILFRVKETDMMVRNLPRDGIAQQDFAWRYNGARIVTSLTTANGGSVDQLNTPFMAIDDDIRPGRCWAFPGRTGQLGLKFPDPVIITHITIDHIAKEVALSMQNAPQWIRVWGFLESGDFPASTQRRSTAGKTGPAIADPGLTFLPIATFRYDTHAPNHIQTFPVLPEIATESLAFQGIVAEVLDNWGGETTCIYRIRVHGHRGLLDW